MCLPLVSLASKQQHERQAELLRERWECEGSFDAARRFEVEVWVRHHKDPASMSNLGNQRSDYSNRDVDRSVVVERNILDVDLDVVVTSRFHSRLRSHNNSLCFEIADRDRRDMKSRKEDLQLAGERALRQTPSSV